MREQVANPIPRRATATQRYVPANPHKAGHYSGFHSEDQPYQSTEIEEDDRYYQVRQPTSVRRYQDTEGNQVIQKGNKRIVIHEAPLPKKRQVHWLVYLGAGMLVMVGVWYGLTQFSIWWNNHQLDSQYGFPRTYQTDESVGFGDSQTPTHFIALNLNGQAEVIVCPAANCTKAVVYQVIRLFGDNAASIPVTLSFSDIAHSGKLDMIVHVGDQQIIYLNDGTQFKLQQ
ncbi:MAG: hypothetical protein ACYDER_28580 [Ktedonobacteraceae bacterium]